MAQPNAPEEREGAGDHAQVEKTVGGEGRGGGAMAGGRKLADTHKTRSTAYETRNKLHGEREGITVKLTKGEMETGAARSRLLARRFRARRWWIPATFGCSCCGLCCAWRMQRRGGEAVGVRAGARLLFNRAEERGGRSHDTRRGRQLLQRRARAVPSRAGRGRR